MIIIISLTIIIAAITTSTFASAASGKPAHILGFYQVTNSVTLSSNGNVEMVCNDNDIVTGGGFSTSGGPYQNVQRNGPSSDSSWIVAITIGPDQGPITLNGWAICTNVR